MHPEVPAMAGPSDMANPEASFRDPLSNGRASPDSGRLAPCLHSATRASYRRVCWSGVQISLGFVTLDLHRQTPCAQRRSLALFCVFCTIRESVGIVNLGREPGDLIIRAGWVFSVPPHL